MKHFGKLKYSFFFFFFHKNATISYTTFKWYKGFCTLFLKN